MIRSFFKTGIWQMIFIIVNSAFAVFFLNSLSTGFNFETLFDSVLHTIVIGSSVCTGILLIIPKTQNLTLLKRFSLVSLSILITTFLGVYLTRIFLGLFYQQPFGTFYHPSYHTIVFSLVISATFGFSSYFYITSQNRLEETREMLRRTELDEEKAKSLAVKAQIASLESRIHPHFLFNTLNSIAALIRENPEKAEKMVEKLSALLRYSLDFDSEKLVSLEDELKITKDYLEIEAARFAEKLKFSLDIDSNLLAEKLPAFALQTLVENSIKHVAARRSTQTKISVAVYNGDNELKIDVSDNGFGFSEKDLKSGHGLYDLRERLNNIFPGKAALEIIETDGGKVILKIPLEYER